MRHCVSCEFFTKEPTLDPRSGQQYMGAFCTHQECTDPVDGSAIACNLARTRDEFCGFKGKYFAKAKEPEKAPLLELVKS